MKQFTLEPVLAHRERRETLRQQQHGAALVRLQEAFGVLQELQAERAAAAERLAQLQGAACLDVTAIEQVVRYQERLDEALHQQAQVVRGVQEEVDAALAALVRASQERRALEQLKERFISAQRQESERRETREHDSLATARFERRRHEPGSNQ